MRIRVPFRRAVRQAYRAVSHSDGQGGPAIHRVADTCAAVSHHAISAADALGVVAGAHHAAAWLGPTHRTDRTVAVAAARTAPGARDVAPFAGSLWPTAQRSARR